MFRYLLFFHTLVAIVFAQIHFNDIQGVIARAGFFDQFDEVTSKKPESLEALKKCGDENGPEERKVCVPYNYCNARTGMLDQSGRTDGFGIIDIR